MLKILGRILMILLVTVIMAGGLYALLQNSSLTPLASGPNDQIQTSGGNFPPASQFHERDGNSRFSLGRGLGGILVTLLEIGAITMLIQLAQQTLSKSPIQTQSGSASASRKNH